MASQYRVETLMWEQAEKRHSETFAVYFHMNYKDRSWHEDPCMDWPVNLPIKSLAHDVENAGSNPLIY